MKGINWELSTGIKVESEHKPTYNYIKAYLKKHHKLPTQKDVFKRIAQNHIDEDPKYYEKVMRYKL